MDKEEFIGLPVFKPYDEFVADTQELAKEFGCKLGDTVRRARPTKINLVNDDALYIIDGELWTPVAHDGTIYRQYMGGVS